MPFQGVRMSDERLRFAILSSSGERSMADLCREFGISRQCGYTWLKRYREGGAGDVIVERSRRPHRSPTLSSADVTAAIVALRGLKPDWGARKLHKRLPLDYPQLAAISRSTVHRILLREGLVRDRDRHPPATKRFEREAPNELWQMDFKGPKGFRQKPGPLSVLDDHSRYLLTLEHLASGRIDAVQPCLRRTFEHNGMPDAMLMDHGTPWWNTQSAGGWTRLSVWLMKQGVRVILCGIRHPQTQGKVERFHGALELARRRRGLPEPALHQQWLDDFRREYNQERPHEALGMKTPASVWHKSEKRYEKEVGDCTYPAGVELARLESTGQLKLNGTRWQIAGPLAGELVQLVRIERRVLVFYGTTLVRELDLASQGSTMVEPWPARSQL